MQAATALRPDVCYLLGDESFSNPSKRRADFAVRRTGSWLEKCLELASQSFGPTDCAPLLVATVPGAAVQHHGSRAVEALVAHDEKLAGAAFCKASCSNTLAAIANTVPWARRFLASQPDHFARPAQSVRLIPFTRYFTIRIH